MPQSEAAPPRREIELDLLRGIAILAVVDFHLPHHILTWPFGAIGLPAIGNIGVNIFFVLSGFLVGGLLVKEWRIRGRVDSKRFLIRRGFKIWPQFYLFLLLNLLTGHRTFASVVPALLNVQNYFMVWGNAPHLWSLAVEEHAYLLLTGLLVLAANLRLSMRHVFSVLAVLSGMVVVTRYYLADRSHPVFFATHTRVAAIFYGVMLAILFHSRPQMFQRLQALRPLWIAILVVAVVLLRFHGSKPWTESLRIDLGDLIGIASLMLVYRHRTGKRRSWPYRFVAWIGLYSYGIYLWSVSVLGLTFHVAARMPHYVGLTFVSVAGPVFGIALGVVMTKVVEFPMLRVRDRLFPRRVRSAVEDTPIEAAAITLREVAETP